MVYIRRAFRGSENPLLNNANQINLTVFLISLLYLGSVSIFSFPELAAYRKIGKNLDNPVVPVVLVGKFTLPLLNAALFPTILILRKPDLRTKYWSYMLRVWCLPLTVFRRVSHHVQRRRGYEEI